jgi:hypothetical protein
MRKSVLAIFLAILVAGAGVYYYIQSPGPVDGDTSPDFTSLTASYTGASDLRDTQISLKYIEAEKINSSVTSYPEIGNRTYRFSELDGTRMTSFSLPEGSYRIHMGFSLSNQDQEVYNEISDTTYGVIDATSTERIHVDIATRNQEGDRLIVSPQLDYRDQ